MYIIRNGTKTKVDYFRAGIKIDGEFRGSLISFNAERSISLYTKATVKFRNTFKLGGAYFNECSFGQITFDKEDIDMEDKTQYIGKELEIYAINRYGQEGKIWGGYIVKPGMDIDEKKSTYSFEADSYESYLKRFVVNDSSHQTYSSKDIGWVVKDLCDAYQSEFDTSQIDTSTGITGDFDLTDKPLAQAIKEVLAYGSYSYFVNMDKQIIIFKKADVYGIADSSLSLGSERSLFGEATFDTDYFDYNHLPNITKYNDGLIDDFLCNKVTIVGSDTSYVGTHEDSTSISTYGKREAKFRYDFIDSATKAQEFAERYISIYKDPFETFNITIKDVIYDAYPPMWVEVYNPTLNIEEDYPIITVRYVLNKGLLTTSFVLGRERYIKSLSDTLLSDTVRSLAQS